MSKVRVGKHRLSIFREGNNALNAVLMDNRTPMLVHHDCNGLFYRLTPSILNRALD